MKKNNKNSYDDFSSLNSELGSFGLEPPKSYKNNQQQNPSKKSQKSKKQTNKKAKQKKKRKASKLVKKVVSAICIILSIIAIVVVLSLTVFFKIENIKIINNNIYTTEQIQAVLPIDTQKNLFLIDKKGAEAKLEQNLPYIYDVEITRKLPSTVVVKIIETPQVYSIKNPDETYILLDDTFKVLESNATELPENNIEIIDLTLSSIVVGQTATIEDDQVKADITALINSIKRLKLGEATAIQTVDVNNNYVIYDNRITIKLGTIDDIDNKLYSALTAIEKLNESDPRAEGVLTATDVKQIYFTDKQA